MYMYVYMYIYIYIYIYIYEKGGPKTTLKFRVTRERQRGIRKGGS